LLGFAAFLGLSASAIAAPTNANLLTGFDAIISGNFTTSSESEGPILVGGNLSGSGTVQSFGTPLPTGLTGFGSINVIGKTSGASYNANGLTVKVGTADQGATFSGASSVTYNASFPASFSSLWTQLGQLSTALSALATTAGSSLSGGTFTAGAATVNGVANVAVLNITASQLQAVANPSMNLGSAQLLIINVDASGSGGSYAPAGGTNFNGQAYAGNVLWNFYNASSLTFGVEFGGTVLHRHWRTALQAAGRDGREPGEQLRLHPGAGAGEPGAAGHGAGGAGRTAAAAVTRSGPAAILPVRSARKSLRDG
jgi:choice-of-anchor A domain-containing protein